MNTGRISEVKKVAQKALKLEPILSHSMSVFFNHGYDKRGRMARIRDMAKKLKVVNACDNIYTIYLFA